MRSPFYFIVRPLNNRRYDNIRSIGGLDIIISASEEDYTVSNRQAVVESVPIGYEGNISPGDVLLVHHNVFKYYNDMQGRQRSGRSFIKDGLFFVDSDQFFMYKKGEEWYTHDRYCFVSPISPEKAFISNFSKEEALMGTMEYPNDYLLNLGVKKGDKVAFPPYSKYEFNVDGKKMYRMFDHQIVMAL